MKITLYKLKQIIRNIIIKKEKNKDIKINDLKNYIKKNNITQENITFFNPNFEFEWDEAIRYKIFNVLGKDFYLNKANQGYIIKTSEIKGKLSNTELNYSKNKFNSLEHNKKERFFEALKNRVFERSIAIKLNNDRYELLAGNTRLTGLNAIGFDHEIWIIDLSDLVEASQELIALL